MLLHRLVLHVDQKAQPEALNKVHHQKRLVVGRDAMFERVDQIRVLQQNGDLAFAGFVPFWIEASLESKCLGLVENLEGDFAA